MDTTSTDTATPYTAPAALVTKIKAYEKKTENGQTHVDRWKGALEGLCVEDFPGIDPMSSATAQTHADKG